MGCKLLYGVGNTDGMACKIDGKMTPEYTLWSNMLARCYSEKYKTNNPHYVGCTVSDNFKDFRYFVKWCGRQKGYNMNGWALDKDILVKHNKIYSEDTCCFVPREINNLLTKRNGKRGDLPIGVSSQKGTGRYLVYMSVKGRIKYFGTFSDVNEAFQTYKTVKLKHIKDVVGEWKECLDVRVYNALMCWNIELDD